MATEQRDVSGFSEVALRDTGTLIITQGDTEALTIEAEDNIIPRIKTEVINNKLTIGLEDSTTTSETIPIQYKLSVKDLNAIELAGSGHINTSSLKADALKVLLSGSGSIKVGGVSVDSLDTGISGSGSVTVGGTAPKMTVDLSGSGSFNGKPLDSKEAKVTVSGSGSATLHVSDKLDIDIPGSGTVSYMGNPTVTKNITGSGQVTKIEDK